MIILKVMTWERVFNNKHIFQLVESAGNEQEKDESLGNGKIQGFLGFLWLCEYTIFFDRTRESNSSVTSGTVVKTKKRGKKEKNKLVTTRLKF